MSPVGRQLLLLQILHETPVPGGYGTTISISPQGNRWLELNQRSPLLEVNPTADLAPFLKYSKGVSKSGDAYTPVATVISANQSHSS